MTEPRGWSCHTKGEKRRISSVIFRRKITEEKVPCHTTEKITTDFRRDFLSRPRKSSGTTVFRNIITSAGRNIKWYITCYTYDNPMFMIGQQKIIEEIRLDLPSRVAETYTSHVNISRRISSVMTEKSLKNEQIHSQKKIFRPPCDSRRLFACFRTTADFQRKITEVILRDFPSRVAGPLNSC